MKLLSKNTKETKKRKNKDENCQQSHLAISKEVALLRNEFLLQCRSIYSFRQGLAALHLRILPLACQSRGGYSCYLKS